MLLVVQLFFSLSLSLLVYRRPGSVIIYFVRFSFLFFDRDLIFSLADKNIACAYGTMTAAMNRTELWFFLDINGSIELNETTDDSHSALLARKLLLVERLTIYITFVVTVIGIIGNGVTIIVLNQETMRKWRSSILLSALAAVDFLFLLIIFLSIMDILTHQAIGLHRYLVLCHITVYITHVCSFLSAAFTLSFTLQRFVAVLFPLHANMIISNRSSVINITLLVAFACTFYSFSFFVTNISLGQCREDESYPVLFPLLIVDICLTFVLPFIIILLCNFAIVCKLQSRKQFTNRFGKAPVRMRHPRSVRLQSPSQSSFLSPRSTEYTECFFVCLHRSDQRLS